MRELRGHPRRDYAGYLELYGQTPIARPTPPASHSKQERKAWEEQVDAQLAPDRLWGQYVGMWRRGLETLDSWEASLK